MREAKRKPRFSHRLPSHFRPERYCIVLRPDLENFTFYGEETVYFHLAKARREIILHAKDLDIERAEFMRRGWMVPAKSIKYDAAAERVTLSFPQTLPAGKGRLKLIFRGGVNETMRGLYRSRYWTAGKEKYLITTQFEATDARRMFPCVDEPAAKAVFDVTVIVPRGTTVVSNTVPATVKEHEPGWEAVKFLPTPKMSTYLLAVVAGDLEFVEGKTKEGIVVRVFTTPGKKEQGRFALRVAKRCLSFYNRYFGIPYPLPVLDLIAVPDFESAAMENWGAVTYRESAILIDPRHSSVHNRRWVAMVIAHELAHQWFGNLVTMEWWTHLWLNEGFARYMEYLTLHHLFPRWKMWDKFSQEVLGPALRLDALANTHPIEVPIHHPREIAEIFDEISYSKGAAVIRMLADYLGPTHFRDGLRHYLKKHSYANATTADLWLALEHVSKKPVGKLMRAWTTAAGYPLLTVSRTRNGKWKVEQSRFFSSPLAVKSNPGGRWRWHIPLRFTTGDKVESRIMSSRRIFLSAGRGGTPPRFNVGGSYFYRTDYPAEVLHSFRRMIREGKLESGERLSLWRDAAALAEAGKLSSREALIFASAYRLEKEYTVWVEIARWLNFMDHLWVKEEFYPAYRQFCRYLFSGVAKRLGWRRKKRDSHDTILLRSLALYQAGRYGEEKIIRRARELFWGWRPVHPDLRGAVYSLAAMGGGEREYRELVRRYRLTELQEEKNRLAGAMASFRQPEILRKTLKFALSADVRHQDSPAILAAVLRNPWGRQLGWEFMKRNWPALVARYGEGHILSQLITAAEVLSRPAEARDFKNFFRKRTQLSIRRGVGRALEQIQTNLLWRRRDCKVLRRWFRGSAWRELMNS